MNQPDVFTGGVEPGAGGLLGRLDIKLLLCYILSSVDVPLSGELLTQCLLSESLANYFEIGQALSSLTASGNLLRQDRDGQALYTVSEEGQKAAKTLETMVPFTVRQKAVRCAVRLLYLEKNSRDAHVEITPQGSGYRVSCTVREGETDLLAVSLLLPDKLAAEEVKANFTASPTEFYRKTLEVFTGKTV